MKRLIPFFVALFAAASLSAQETEEQLDAKRRQFINNFIAEYEQAYEQMRIDFIREFFSPYSLIITETTEKGEKKIFKLSKGGGEMLPSSDKKRPYYTVVEDRETYIARLNDIFNKNESISISLTKCFIERSRINGRIYGVNFMQQWKDSNGGDNLEDDMLGYVFMMVDFRDGASEPVIHVRTWQPRQNIETPSDKYFLKDFTIYDTK